jgi:hypothetical protein
MCVLIYIYICVCVCVIEGVRMGRELESSFKSSACIRYFLLITLTNQLARLPTLHKKFITVIHLGLLHSVFLFCVYGWEKM